MFKKILIGLVALVVLLVIAAVAIVAFVDVDRFKPQIEQAVAASSRSAASCRCRSFPGSR